MSSLKEHGNKETKREIEVIRRKNCTFHLIKAGERASQISAAEKLEKKKEERVSCFELG